MKLFLVVTFIAFTSCLFAQYQLSGKIIDSKTKTPLAFVNIITGNEKWGTTTDIEGKFIFNAPEAIEKLIVSYVGYEQANINVIGKKIITIALKKTNYQIAEFKVFPGVNPAERIIKEVVKNRKLHNPEKSLDFKYESYNKTYFTFLADSLLITDSSQLAEMHPDELKLLKNMDNYHLFMTETVTAHKFKRPDKKHEKVVASKVSGFKNASLLSLSTQIQAFSFYNETFKILTKSYLNPISVNSVNKYLFLIEDTAYSDLDTVFILSFRPKKGKNFDGLKGLLYVNTGGYALQNVIAEPAVDVNETLKIEKIQQRYKKINGSWFPIQFDTRLSFDPTKEADFEMHGMSTTYLRKIEINPVFSRKDFSYIATEIAKDAHKKNEEYWKENRQDTLSQKEKKTYQIVDSIGNKYNFDRKLRFVEAWATNKINFGLLSFDLDRMISFNKYEGFRLGGGLHTNKKLSKWFSLGGYGAYGFKDKTAKYGGDINFLIHPKKDIEFRFSYEKDVAEPGVAHFYDYRPPLYSSSGNRRLFNLDRMNNIETLEGKFKFRIFKYLKTYLFAKQEKIAVTNNYFYKKSIDEFTFLRDKHYTFNQFGVALRYAFKEKLITTPNYRFAKLSKYPVLYAKIEKGIKQWDGEYDFTAFTFRTEKKFFIKNIGRPSFFIETGYINGDVPQHKLNSSLGTLIPYTSIKTIAISVSTENAFETALPYEFFSNKYVHFHFRHSFGSLLFKIKRFAPEFIVTTSVGWGTLDHPEKHGGVDFKTMEKGYYESGLVIDHIFKTSYIGIGIAAFYRYGPYQFAEERQNFALKFSLAYTIPQKM